MQDGSTPLELARDGVLEELLRHAEEAARARTGGGSDILRALAALRKAGVGTDVTLRSSSGAPAAANAAAAAAAASGQAGPASLRCHSAVLVAQGEIWQKLCCGPLARRAQQPALLHLL